MDSQAKNMTFIKDSLNEAKKLKKQGKLTEAIEKYLAVLKLSPSSVPVLNQLAITYEQKKEFDTAINYLQQLIKLQPERAQIQARLAKAMMENGMTEDVSTRRVIAIYQKAIALQPNLPLWVYSGLGDCLIQAGQIDEAISTYQKAIELAPDNPNLYLKLTQLYAQKTIKLKSDLSESLADILNYQVPEKEVATSLKHLNQGETYSKIWETLNQTSLESLEQQSNHFPTQFNQSQLRRYFQRTSQYKVVHLESVTDEDKSFLETSGLSLTYLKQNQKLVTQEGVSGKKSIERGELEPLLKPAIEEGYIYAVCPSTGRIVKSNRSVFVLPSGTVFYRFVTNEVFYLFCNDGLQKIYLYFPRLDLIILNDSIKRYKFHEDGITRLKAFFVVHWITMKTYITNTALPQKNALIPTFVGSIAHQVFNCIFPIHKLCEIGYLQNIDYFYILGDRVAESNYGKIDEIFPEIHFSKIEHSKLLNQILENNLFVFPVRNSWSLQYISDSCADRIYQAMLKKCSSSFLAEVKEAKDKCFPLLWINFRTHTRTWVSKVEGIANIIKNLSTSFPNIGVVFDGFTRTDIKGELLVNPADEEIIKQEKDILNQIRSHLPQEVKVYDLIGCPMHEVIIWAYAIDLYMIPVGSGLIKTRIPNKPGVVHSGNLYGQLPRHEEMRENCVVPVAVPKDKIVKKLQKGEKESDSSYDFDWKIAYEKLLKIASSIKREQ